jgi:metal-responsive CopG/Arc/MetJ family transcriptional regulator
LRAVDKLAGRGGNRSRIIEAAVRELVLRGRRAERDARDRAILEQHADEFAALMEDVLAYQVEP